jgi:hypothetical protein
MATIVPRSAGQPAAAAQPTAEVVLRNVNEPVVSGHQRRHTRGHFAVRERLADLEHRAFQRVESGRPGLAQLCPQCSELGPLDEHLVAKLAGEAGPRDGQRNRTPRRRRDPKVRDPAQFRVHPILHEASRPWALDQDGGERL